jgi:EmrB/QacA subfamily drug resistance transporter
MTFTGLLILASGFLLMTLAITPEVSRRMRVRGVSHKWWVLATIGVGNFMTIVLNGSVLVALPEIEDHFNTGLPTVQWVVLGYSLTISVLLLPMGRLGDMAGRKRVYLAGLTIFVAASALAGSSPNVAVLIASKVIQGVGGAMIQGNGMATIVSAFPASERGKALGVNMSVVGTGAIAGPALGGLLINSLGWRSVFFVNVPVGLATIAATALVLREQDSSQAAAGEQRPAFDWLGAALSGGALLVFLLVVSSGHKVGWASPAIAVGAVAAVALLAAFIWWELRVSSPMLDVRLFKRKLLGLGVMSGWLAFLGTSSLRFMMPFYLQRVLEYSPGNVGLIMIPPALCMVVLGPISGRLSDKFGWRFLTMGGQALSAVALFVLAATLTENSSLALIIAMLMLQSAGTGLFHSPNNSSIFSAVEKERYGVVSGLTQLMRNSANVTSVATATVVVVITMGSMGVEPSLGAVSPQVADAFVAGLQRAFFLFGGCLAIGLVVSFLRGERPKETPAPVGGTGSEDSGG